MKTPQRVLVLGASGTLGRAVVGVLRRRGYAVRGASRHPARVATEADEAVAADLLDPVSFQAACAGVDAIVQAAGAPLDLKLRLDRKGFRGVDTAGTRNVVAAAQAAGVGKLVYVSVYSTPAFAETPYVAAHREAAEAVRASGLAHAVVQPTGFFDAFAAYLPLARLGVLPLIGDGSARTNPIHTIDLAEVIVDALEGEATEIPAGGPEVLTRRAIAELAFVAVGKTPRFVPAPAALLRFNARAAGVVDRRLGELLRFLRAVSLADAVAPTYGHYRLGPYLAEVATRRPPP